MTSAGKIKDSNAICMHCDTRMVVIKVKKHPGKWPISFLVFGLTSFLFIHFGGPIVGIPLMLLGGYMFMAEEVLNMCPKCGYYFDVLCARRADQ